MCRTNRNNYISNRWCGRNFIKSDEIRHITTKGESSAFLCVNFAQVIYSNIHIIRQNVLVQRKKAKHTTEK